MHATKRRREVGLTQRAGAIKHRIIVIDQVMFSSTVGRVMGAEFEPAVPLGAERA
jgi:hypothetical protein